MRFGGRCVFMCRNAFTHWTSPVVIGGRLAAAFVAGPVLTIEEDDFFEHQLLEQLEIGSDPSLAMTARELYDRVPRVAPGRVTLYSLLLLELARSLSLDDALLREAAESLDQQSRINEYVQELKTHRGRSGRDPERPTYPLEKEAALLAQIRAGEVEAAQKTLNELLSHVFFAAGAEMAQVKMRSRELVVLLSRAVVTEGADPEEVFGLNYQFVEAIDHQEDVNGVAYWMARIVRRFADLVFYLPHLSHARALRRAVTHVRRNLGRSLRVADVAAVAGLSPSHFSRVFRDEIGETFVSYVNRIRCEEAADLLRSTDLPVQAVGERCGFGDHSYFTRVFRGVMGSPPSAYRAG